MQYNQRESTNNIQKAASPCSRPHHISHPRFKHALFFLLICECEAPGGLWDCLKVNVFQFKCRKNFPVFSRRLSKQNISEDLSLPLWLHRLNAERLFEELDDECIGAGAHTFNQVLGNQNEMFTRWLVNLLPSPLHCSIDPCSCPRNHLNLHCSAENGITNA